MWSDDDKTLYIARYQSAVSPIQDWR